MIYVQKDINETLDYVFIRNVEDDIVSVTYTQDSLGGLVVDNCTTNSGDVVLDEGTVYPAGRAIILWVSGGIVGGKEKVILTYTTTAGRVRDEAIIFTLVQEN